MKIYFYHTQNIQDILSRYRQGQFPGHLLYGATHLEDYGIEIVWHQFIKSTSRIKRMLLTAWRVLRLGNKIDAVYATHYTGIEILIFLRALGIFHKPIAIWHHQPVVKSSSKIREILGHLFYKGIDEMFFFSQKLIDDSIKTHKVDPLRLHLGYWGADLDFYDRLLAEQHHREGFVSSGKEMRDMDTLVRAFNDEELPLDIYLNRSNGEINYERLFSSLHIKENIKVHFTTSQGVPELARLVNKHSCVVICCQDTKYTVGLTTVVEALALGLPVICSRNLQIPVDFNKEGCGISVPYYDVEEWKNAVNYIHTHPEKAKERGRKGRVLAERLYNDRHCAEVVAQVLKAMNS